VYGIPSAWAVAFAPNGRTALSASDDKTLRLWDVASGSELRRFKGHTDLVKAVAFAPDGHTVLSGAWDRTLRLWDVANGAELRRFTDHIDQINAVAFVPGCRVALSASEDKTLRLWDLASGASLAVLHLGASLKALAIAATTPPSVVVGDDTGGIWVLDLHIPR
jgi:WD40 repeat protein